MKSLDLQVLSRREDVPTACIPYERLQRDACGMQRPVPELKSDDSLCNNMFVGYSDSERLPVATAGDPKGADALVVLTEWPEFGELDWDAIERGTHAAS
jgi:hypothetical protein